MYNNNEALTEPQMTVLCNLIQQQIDRHQKPDSVESKLIDEDNKNLWFMWGKIKRKYQSMIRLHGLPKRQLKSVDAPRQMLSPL